MQGLTQEKDQCKSGNISTRKNERAASPQPRVCAELQTQRSDSIHKIEQLHSQNEACY